MQIRKSTRQERQWAKKLAKKAFIQNNWGEWELRIPPTLKGIPYSNGLIQAWLNDVFAVQEYKGPRWNRLMINRHDHGIINWRELQRIKTELLGDEVLCLQAFPRTSKLVDECNMYWLFIVPCDQLREIEKYMTIRNF